MDNQFLTSKTNIKKTIGLLGGMGPEAGLYFNELIIKMTPASCDQEHIPIVLYSNPQIPNRTLSILNNEPNKVIEAISQSLKKLEAFGVSEIFIPCNTSFTYYDDFKHSVSVPVYNLPQETLANIKNKGHKKVFLLATKGTYISGVYKRSSEIEVEYPTDKDKIIIHSLIEAIKSGDEIKKAEFFEKVVNLIDEKKSVILGCTELSVLTKEFRTIKPKNLFVDPLEVAASYIVKKYSTI